MAEIIVSSSSDMDERDIDEYHDESNSGGSSSESSSGESSSLDEQYSSGVPRVPLEVFQEELRQRMASRSSVGPSTSVPSSIPSLSEEDDILYCCVVGIP